MSWRYPGRWLLVAFAGVTCSGGGAFAAPDQPLWAHTWMPEMGFSDVGPTCILYPPDGIDPSGLYLTFNWNARDGSVLSLRRRPDEIPPSVRIESEGSNDAWDIRLEPVDLKLDGRRALLGTDVAAGIMRSLELGRALTVVLNFYNGTTLRYHVPARGAHITVPMYQACMKSVTDDPPKYLFHPGRPFLGSYMGGERCEFAQIIELQRIPVIVNLSAEATGGEFVFERSLRSHGHHGPHQTRKGPDRIEAQQLFSQGFDLVEEYRYGISTDQLNELAADLSRGNTRKFILTTPEGAKSTLNFGGALGKPFAAMFEACRKARFAPKSTETQ